LFEHQFIHADPNLGNYLFSDSGQLGLIDFGCVRRLGEAALRALRRVYTLEDSDPQAIERIHAEMGVSYRPSTSRAQLNRFLSAWSEWISEPYRRERFDFGDGAYFERGAVLEREAREIVHACDGAFLYFGRAHHGLMRLLQNLGVSVDMRFPH
jgi:hypothetical protein